MSCLSPIAISLNFDSLNEAYGFPTGFSDISFFAAFGRLAELAAKYSIPLSIYIIGKDLEHSGHAARVRDWYRTGYEIGNHTWSHDYSLGSRSVEAIRQEIRKSHNIIAEVIGVEPCGFIAPAWSTSKAVVCELIRLNYKYDSSIFPSIFLYPLVIKSLFSHKMNIQKGIKILGRRDWHLPLCAPLEPYFVNKSFKKENVYNGENRLLLLPLPTSSRLNMCSWHTAGFFLGWDKHLANVELLSKSHDGFYYVIHPADFLGPDDLSPQYDQYLERMNIPLAEKMSYLENVFQVIKASGRTITTMEKLADYFINKHFEEALPV